MKTKLAFLVLFLMLPLSTAMAVECDTNADCPEGSECVAIPCACACPGCDPDSQDCSEMPPCECPDCPEGGECMEINFDPGQWYGDDCSVDADCPMDFTCQEIPLPCATEPSCPPCACSGCDPDSEDCTDPPDCECEACEEPDPVECEETTAKVCVYEPKECTADADCQEGFECLEIEECSGGGGCACTSCACPDCPDGEECPPCDCPADPPPCECEKDFQEECTVVGAFCAPKQVECAEDTDCPEGWECAATVVGGACLCPDCACAPCAEGEECPACECEPCDCGDPEVTESYCLPAGWDEAGYGSYEGQAAGTAKEEDDTNTDPEDPAAQEPSPEPDGTANDGTGGAAENAATDDGGATGCTAGGAPARGIGLLLLAGLAALVLRRSRQKVTL